MTACAPPYVQFRKMMASGVDSGIRVLKFKAHRATVCNPAAGSSARQRSWGLVICPRSSAAVLEARQLSEALVSGPGGSCSCPRGSSAARRRASAQDTLDNVLVCNVETCARYKEEIRRRDAQNKELDDHNAKLVQRFEHLERERETSKDEAARHCTRNTAHAAPHEYAPTPENKEEEVLAPVSEVFELLIVEPETAQKEYFVISVPMNAVGARLRATINRNTDTIHMGGLELAEDYIRAPLLSRL